MEEVIKGKIWNTLVLVVGDITVGKTTAIRRLAQRPTINKIVPTVAIEFYAAELTVCGTIFRLHFWDTCTTIFM